MSNRQPPAISPQHLEMLVLNTLQDKPVPKAQVPANAVKWALKEGLIREVLPVTEGDPVCIQLTSAGRERSLALRPPDIPIIGLDISRHGLRINRDMNKQEWARTMEQVRIVKEAYHTTLGDLISYGRSRFGDDYVDSQLEQLEFSFDDVTHATSIGKVPLVLRESVQLTSEHYYILGLKFPDDPTSQEMWAARAKEHRLSPIALRRSIECGAVLTDDQIKDQSGRDSGIPVLHGMSMNFQRWQATVGGREAILAWDYARKAEFIKELTPMVELALRVRETMGD